MRVVLTAEARADLEAIGDSVALDNPQRARSFVAELLAKAMGLAEMPTAFPHVPRYAARGIRRRKHGRYLIFYRVAHFQDASAREDASFRAQRQSF